MRVFITLMGLLMIGGPSNASDFSGEKFTQEKINKLVAESAIELCKKANTDNHITYIKYNSSCEVNSKLWDVGLSNTIINGMECVVRFIKKKDGKDMSEALDDLIDKGGKLECAIFQGITILVGLRDVINGYFGNKNKSDKFFNWLCDRLDEQTGKAGFIIGGKSGFMMGIQACFLEPIDNQRVGTYFYVTSVLEYNGRHPGNCYTGINSVVVDSTNSLKVIGLGSEFSKGPIEAKQVVKILYDEYMKEPTQEELEILKSWKLEPKGIMDKSTWNEKWRELQKSSPFSHQISSERVNQMIASIVNMKDFFEKE